MKIRAISRRFIFSLVLSIAVGAEAGHQMDLLIGKRRSSLKHDDRYLPKKQPLSVGIKRRARFFVRGQHDLEEMNAVGFGTGIFSIRGSRELEMTVLQLGKGGRKNVTRQITKSPGVTLSDFMIDDQVDFLVKLKRASSPSKRRPSRKFETIKVLGILVSSDRSRDRVEARVRLR